MMSNKRKEPTVGDEAEMEEEDHRLLVDEDSHDLLLPTGPFTLSDLWKDLMMKKKKIRMQQAQPMQMQMQLQSDTELPLSSSSFAAARGVDGEEEEGVAGDEAQARLISLERIYNSDTPSKFSDIRGDGINCGNNDSNSNINSGDGNRTFEGGQSCCFGTGQRLDSPDASYSAAESTKKYFLMDDIDMASAVDRTKFTTITRPKNDIYSDIVQRIVQNRQKSTLSPYLPAAYWCCVVFVVNVEEARKLHALMKNLLAVKSVLIETNPDNSECIQPDESLDDPAANVIIVCVKDILSGYTQLICHSIHRSFEFARRNVNNNSNNNDLCESSSINLMAIHFGMPSSITSYLQSLRLVVGLSQTLKRFKIQRNLSSSTASDSSTSYSVLNKKMIDSLIIFDPNDMIKYMSIKQVSRNLDAGDNREIVLKQLHEIFNYCKSRRQAVNSGDEGMLSANITSITCRRDFLHQYLSSSSSSSSSSNFDINLDSNSRSLSSGSPFCCDTCDKRNPSCVVVGSIVPSISKNNPLHSANAKMTHEEYVMKLNKPFSNVGCVVQNESKENDAEDLVIEAAVISHHHHHHHHKSNNNNNNSNDFRSSEHKEDASNNRGTKGFVVYFGIKKENKEV